MGVAFATVVNSLVKNIVTSVIAMVIGKPDFSGLTFHDQRSVFRYGAFLTDLIQFVAIAAAVFFFIVKPVTAMMNRARREPIEEGMPDQERRHQELRAALGQLSR
jgi:large conductance mechanosensitive channel